MVFSVRNAEKDNLSMEQSSRFKMSLSLPLSLSLTSFDSNEVTCVAPENMKGRPSLSPGTWGLGSGHTQHIPQHCRISLGWLGCQLGTGREDIKSVWCLVWRKLILILMIKLYQGMKELSHIKSEIIGQNYFLFFFILP